MHGSDLSFHPNVDVCEASLGLGHPILFAVLGARHRLHSPCRPFLVHVVLRRCIFYVVSLGLFRSCCSWVVVFVWACVGSFSLWMAREGIDSSTIHRQWKGSGLCVPRRRSKPLPFEANTCVTLRCFGACVHTHAPCDPWRRSNGADDGSREKKTPPTAKEKKGEKKRKKMGSEAKAEREKMHEERIRSGVLAKDRT